jgi:hypothetical protein
MGGINSVGSDQGVDGWDKRLPAALGVRISLVFNEQ